MKLAFLYAGQGSQKVQMGEDLYNNNSTFQQVFDEVDPDGTIKKLCFHSELEELSQTHNTQPCMVAFAVALTAVLKEEGIIPDMVAGLSLGEYSALCAAEVFDAKTAVSLAAFRGEVMSKATKDIDCAMVAVIGLERSLLQTVCKEASSLGIVQIANYNCPGQMVIAGERQAVEHASQKAKELGAKRCMPLNVSGAFHTSLMKPAGNQLATKFTSMEFEEPTIPVIFNSTARPLQDGQTIPELLEVQVQSSVYFEDTIRYMQQQGIDTIIEIGPGKTLTSFVRKTCKHITSHHIEDCKTLIQTLTTLKGEVLC